jgi:hypothetical protein
MAGPVMRSAGAERSTQKAGIEGYEAERLAGVDPDGGPHPSRWEIRAADSRSALMSPGIRASVKRVLGPPREIAATTLPSCRRTGAPSATYPASSSPIAVE